MKKPLSYCMALLLGALISATTNAEIYYVGDMTTAELEALDKSKTAVIIPGGIYEEHGPYLPSNTDGYVSERITADVAEAIVAHGWNALILDPIMLGAGGMNEVPAIYPYPGTYTIRVNTLRAIYMDLADEFGMAGFKRIFVFNSHGAPSHNRVIHQAAEYFNDTYDGYMAHIKGSGPEITRGEDLSQQLSKKAREEDTNSGHAGINETSLMLFLRPDLVDPAYKTSPNYPAPGGGVEIMAKNGRVEGWTGYFGAPKYATAEYGAKLYNSALARSIEQALSYLDGKPLANYPPGPVSEIHQASLDREDEIAKRQQDWLKKKGY